MEFLTWRVASRKAAIMHELVHVFFRTAIAFLQKVALLYDLLDVCLDSHNPPAGNRSGFLVAQEPGAAGSIGLYARKLQHPGPFIDFLCNHVAKLGR